MSIKYVYTMHVVRGCAKNGERPKCIITKEEKFDEEYQQKKYEIWLSQCLTATNGGIVILIQ